ncbi:hypothetical protein ROHU_033485 [Labeo rohita]|uniref:Uncharacterized protein n=1 Tax=Labeo rohita TaxID=84645 RepID=A0A498LAK3_LABRO|nr:hypothetical protein ROHU_033485 [Labeo rohita]
MTVKTLRARVSVILNCTPANPLPPHPVAVEPREGRQPRAEGPSDECMSTQFLHAHHSKEPPVSFMKASLRPSDDARDLVSFGAAEDDLDDDDAMSTAASVSGDWSTCLESEASHSQKDLLDKIVFSGESTSGHFESFQDGSYFKENRLLGDKDLAISLGLYVDEFELCNPLGTSRKIHKIVAMYWMVLNLPSKYRSSLHSIQLAALGKSDDVRFFGYEKFLDPLMKDVKCLEQTGVFVPALNHNVDLLGKFNASLDKYTTPLLKLYRKRTDAFGEEMKSLLDKLDEQDTDALSCSTKGVKIGILSVVEDDVATVTSLPTVINIAIILEEAIVLEDIKDLPSAFAYLFGLLYALNMEYPKELKYSFEVIQKVFMDLGGTCSSRVQSLKSKLC